MVWGADIPMTLRHGTRKSFGLHLDKPCILGEFPTKGSKRGVDVYLDAARRDGLAGAFAWSLRATDEYTDFKSAADRFAAWVSGR